MSRAVNPRRFVTFTRDHVVIHPATELITQGVNGEAPQKIADIPEKRDEYKRGQVVDLGTVNRAREFARAMNGAAVVGKDGAT